MPISATPPSDSERRRQAQVLKALRVAATAAAEDERQWKLTPVAARVGVSASQYSRYETGETLLPTTLYAPIARTFGLTKAQLAARLGILDEVDDAPRWSLEAELRAAGMDESHIQRGMDAGHGMPEADQRAFAAGWIRAWQRRATHPQTRDQRPA